MEEQWHRTEVRREVCAHSRSCRVTRAHIAHARTVTMQTKWPPADPIWRGVGDGDMSYQDVGVAVRRGVGEWGLGIRGGGGGG